MIAGTCEAADCKVAIPAGHRIYCSTRCRRRAEKQRERLSAAPIAEAAFQQLLTSHASLLTLDDVDREVLECFNDNSHLGIIGKSRRRRPIPKSAVA